MKKLRLFEPLPLWLPVLAAGGLTVLIGLYACASNRTPVVILLTATAMTFLWANHLRFLQEAGPRKLLRILGGFLGHSLGFILLAIAGLAIQTMTQGTVDCYTNRSRMAELLTNADEIKHQLTAAYMSGKSMKEASTQVSASDTAPDDHLFVTSGGSIIGTQDSVPGFLVLTPHARGQTLMWSCHGAPAIATPKFCKN